MALAVLSISTQAFGVCMMASIYYYVKYILLLSLESQADIFLKFRKIVGKIERCFSRETDLTLDLLMKPYFIPMNF